MLRIGERDCISQIDVLKSHYLLMDTYRNIIIIAGQNAVGKTTTFNVLTQEAKQTKIPYEPRPFSDLFFMLNTLKEDDRQGGFNHYHECCAQKEGGHNHSNGEAELPFTINNNKLIDAMFFDFFTALTISRTDRFLFIEWTGGRNINLPNEPASRADFSFERIGRMLQEGSLPSAWLERVYAVIHPTADNSTRHALNERKHTASLEEIATGTVSPIKSSVVLDIFGEDDFFHVESLLQNRGIPIYPIKNDATPRFYERLREASREFFSPGRGIETQSPQLSISKEREIFMLK